MFSRKKGTLLGIIFLSFVLMLLILPGVSFAYSGGSGTASDPYLISTPQDLDQIRNNLSAYFKLVNDIDLNGISWIPIGTSSISFKGTIDGNGCVIRNLTVNQTSDYAGLFGYINGGTVKNLGFENAKVGGRNYIGTLAGNAFMSTITDIYVKGSTITGSGYDVGGLVGYQSSGAISNCYAVGNTVTGNSDTGGLIGVQYYGSISTCYVSGGQVSSSSYMAGGLAGDQSAGSISNAFAIVKVYGKGYVGGLVGYKYQGTITNTYATGNVYGNESAGGLTSYDSYGGVTNSYWDAEASGQTTSASGIRETTAQMKQQATFAGWDFVNTWDIKEGASYPWLRALPKPTEVGGTLEISSINVLPGTLSLQVNQSAQITVIAYYSDGTTQDVTNSATYQSSDTSVATVSNTGLVTAIAPGTANITVSYQDQTVTVPVTVTAPAPTLEKITASPNPVSVTVGQSQQATVTAVYSDGSTKDVTGETAYQIQDTTTASVNKGLVTGLKAGDTSMTITYNGQSVTVPIMVTAPTVTKITVTPNALNLAVNESQQLSVTATYSDGSSKNVTNQASYQSGDANVASVNSAGLAMGVNPGSTNITATFGGQSATVPVTVNAGSAELVNLIVNPISMYIAKGQTQQLSVTAVYSDGTSKNVTTEATYQSSDANVAAVSSTGLVTAADFGSAQMTVTYEAKSVVVPVNVGQYTVTSAVRAGTQVPPSVSSPGTPPARKSTAPTVTSLRDRISGHAGSWTVTCPPSRNYGGDDCTVSRPPARKYGYGYSIPVTYPER